MWRGWWIALLFCGAAAARIASAQVSLYTVVDMALRNSNAVHMAEADVRRAAAGMAESRDVYLPNLVVGSSLGYSYGFPLGNPSIYNVQSNSLLFNYSQRDYIRSSRAAFNASEHQLRDARQQVVLDASLAYIQLDKFSRQLAALDAERDAASRLVSIEQQRVDAGLEGRTELTRAQLIGAQTRLKRIHIENQAADVRQRLADLTGLAPDALATQTSSIPPDPDYRANGSLVKVAMASNEGIKASTENAQSKRYMAFGDNRINYRPQIGLGLTYSRFAAFNNYTSYYKNFQPNNFGIGLEIKIPLFDARNRAHARGSAADAAHADAQTRQARFDVAEQTSQLEHSLAELEAQEEVAQLQSDLAQQELDAISTQLENGSGSPGAATVTPKNAQEAHLEERRRFEDMLDARFELTRAELGMLRTMGTIEDWAKTIPHQ